MKTIQKFLLILLISNLGFSQISKTIHNKDGLTVSYALSKIGNAVNPATGTNFSKYKLHLTVQNSNSKFWAYNAINSISAKNVKSGIIKLDDETFCWNGGRSTIDHFCIEDNCSDFPRYSNVAAPHQVICPSGKQECEKTFLYPTDLAGEPEIEWTSWGFVEMIGSVKNTNSKESKKNEETKSKYYYFGRASDYFNGINGFPKDTKKAIICLDKAGEMGLGIAWVELAGIYEYGKAEYGIPENKAKAKEYFKKACNIGENSGCVYYQIMTQK